MQRRRSLGECALFGSLRTSTNAASCQRKSTQHISGTASTSPGSMRFCPVLPLQLMLLPMAPAPRYARIVGFLPEDCPGNRTNIGGISMHLLAYRWLEVITDRGLCIVIMQTYLSTEHKWIPQEPSSGWGFLLWIQDCLNMFKPLWSMV